MKYMNNGLGLGKACYHIVKASLLGQEKSTAHGETFQRQ
jgi:hypothetical protein